MNPLYEIQIAGHPADVLNQREAIRRNHDGSGKSTQVLDGLPHLLSAQPAILHQVSDILLGRDSERPAIAKVIFIHQLIDKSEYKRLRSLVVCGILLRILDTRIEVACILFSVRVCRPPLRAENLSHGKDFVHSKGVEVKFEANLLNLFGLNIQSIDFFPDVPIPLLIYFLKVRSGVFAPHPFLWTSTLVVIIPEVNLCVADRVLE